MVLAYRNKDVELHLFSSDRRVLKKLWSMSFDKWWATYADAFDGSGETVVPRLVSLGEDLAVISIDSIMIHVWKCGAVEILHP